MFVDSHCHLDFPELRDRVSDVLRNMRDNRVTHALCVGVAMPDWTNVVRIAEQHDNLFASVGVHPDQAPGEPVAAADFAPWLKRSKVVAIGETGLDYFRSTGDLEWQRDRFRMQIRVARDASKPLIIHTRSAAEDTLRVMREENAAKVGGVMHCFTESWGVAEQAMEMNFYISFSGIVTFKNAAELKEVARKVPLDRLLIETDSPYLAPVPYRGKTNEPAYVRYVAEEIARLKEISVEEVGAASSRNFFALFGSAAAASSA